jgi:uncharacterized protein (UPF0332 family)
VLCNFKGELHLLCVISSINALLHDAAAMLVASYLNALSHHGIIDELVELWLPSEEYLLDNVISVDILCELSNSVL